MNVDVVVLVGCLGVDSSLRFDDQKLLTLLVSQFDSGTR